MSRKALFLGTFEDKNYLPHLKQMFGDMSVYVLTAGIDNLTHLEMYCEQRGITSVVSTDTNILTRLVAKLRSSSSGTKDPSLNDYAGSLFSHKGIDIVFVDPLKQLITVPYGKFITSRFVSKISAPHLWAEPTRFSFEVIDTPSKQLEALKDLTNAVAIAYDIETIRHNLAIRCIGFTGIFTDSSGVLITRSYCLPLRDTFDLTMMRKILDLPNEKIFQNGKYDNAYLLRYNSPARNWLWDTANFMHCQYSELPKDLGFLNAFFLRKVVFWKDLAETTDLYEYYKYNALDTWATANVWIQQILTAPEYARRNYYLEFPLNFPLLLSEMTGLKRDTEKLQEARKEIDEEISSTQGSLDRMLGVSLNSNSPPQVKNLLKVLGCGDLESSDEKNLEKASLRHPINRIILDKIKKIRELRKAKGTYLRTDEDLKLKKDGTPYANANGSKDYKGFVLYSLNSTTDTGRLASGEHQFWCGANIQNTPTGVRIKQTIVPFSGHRFGEVDLEQAESRDTAFIAGSEPLIAAVTSDRDFHSVNASSFFGVAYDSIYDSKLRKTINKKLRDLAKRVNHGANYNMGPGVLVDTMGEQNIWEAAALLKLPKGWNTKQIAEYLLECFHKTYPELKRDYYASVIREVATTRRLTSRACHILPGDRLQSESNSEKWIADGDWTRYTFGNPGENKRDLNSYVAHCPQSLNSRTLNEAYLRVFYEIALPEAHDFKLHAQIHDSIFFSFKEGRTDLCEKVKELMEIPVKIKSVDGKFRTFTVPAAIKAGRDGQGALRWSETE